MPTTVREFAREDAVNAFVRVYQGSRARPSPASIQTRIVDARDAEVHASSVELPVEKFSGSPLATDFLARLPLSGLASGEYLLTIEATAGEHRVSRQARFIVP